MNQPSTKDDLKQATREIISRFNESQSKQNEQLKEMGIQLGEIAEDVSKVKFAFIDLLATDRHMHNLVRELKAHGVKLDETKIFASS
ncbi:MAG: hypothetical protein HY420_05015 [Candidatus Kerfeldbacteria bacterium]|nr:hypothetical protein [Candidatus Kerfeldbacteria bacterium]